VTRARLVAALPFVPAFVVAATWVVWATDNGGYFPVARFPGALLAAGLLVTIAIARPPGALVRSPALLPLALLAGWTAWNAISIAWTNAADNGWDATNELLAVTVMGAVMAFTPWRIRSVMVLLSVWAAAITVIAVVDFATFAASSDPGSRLLEGRYLGPIGYANGSAALGAMAFWPLLAVAAGPRFPAAARIVALPAAVAVLAWALLPQSRGTMIGGLAVVPLFIALSSHRTQVLTRMAVVAGALAICVPALFDVYTAARENRGLDDVVETAATRTAIAAALALVASIVLVAIERRVRPSEGTLRWTRRLGIAAVVVIVLGSASVAAARQQHIRDGVSDRWHTFSSFADVVNDDTGARIGQIIPDKRYDYWKVAWAAYRDAPVVGIGAGGYEVRYAANKLYPKHSRYVHDIWLRGLTETGVIGFVLLVATLLSGLVLLVRSRVRNPGAAPAIAAVAALATAFFLQCSLDWLEEVPALLAPAVCLPLAVLRAAAPETPRRVIWGIPVALAAIAFVAMTPPYLAARDIARGDDLRASDPRGALEAYDRAAGLNPVAVEPHLSRGFVALDLRDAALARRSFEEALDVREDWVAHFELGLLDSQAGRQRRARAQIETAARMNRNDPIVTDALAAIEDGERLDPLEVNRQALTQPVFGAPP
jgi:O-antigen ligase/polysaccharide polymerase Wzy-like membrane protein